MNATPYARLSFLMAETNKTHEQQQKQRDHPTRYNIQMGNRQQETFQTRVSCTLQGQKRFCTREKQASVEHASEPYKENNRGSG
jgi:hypothetical protein